MESLSKLNSLLNPLKRRIMLMVARGVVNLTTDSEKAQLMQIGLLSDELRDQIESMSHFGFSSYPPNGSEVVSIFHGGNRDHGIVIATGDTRTRPKNLNEGESILYNKEGDYIKLKSNGDIEIKTSTKVKILGDLEVTGTSTAKDHISDVSLNDHIHPVPQNPNTEKPIS